MGDSVQPLTATGVVMSAESKGVRETHTGAGLWGVCFCVCRVPRTAPKIWKGCSNFSPLPSTNIKKCVCVKEKSLDEKAMNTCPSCVRGKGQSAEPVCIY